MNDLIWVQVTITVNGVDCCYTSSASRHLWEMPEYKLAIIEKLKRALLEKATRGMEPKVEVFDEMPMRGGPIPELSTTDSVQIGAHR